MEQEYKDLKRQRSYDLCKKCNRAIENGGYEAAFSYAKP